MGHGTCTCQGAAFEYTFNVEHELVQAGVRDKAEVIYITNEAKLGDFGMDGMNFGTKQGVVSSQMFTESLFKQRGVKAIMAAAVESVEPGVVHYEQLDGTKGEQRFDFAMLLPPFRGADLKAFDREGNDITDQVFAPSGFMKVDADYSPKPYEQWRASDWPRTYQSVKYDNVWAAGIAFAPPHQMSKPRKTPNGTVIAPAPPRTGMPSGVIGRAVAKTIAERVKHGDAGKVHTASMAEMGAACIASAGTGLAHGTGCGDDRLPDHPRQGQVRRAGPGHQGDVRRDRAERPLDEGDAALPVHLQGQGAPLLAPDPGVRNPMSNLNTFPDAPVPDAKELKSRKNIVVQGIRFAVLNLKMITMVNKGHH